MILIGLVLLATYLLVGLTIAVLTILLPANHWAEGCIGCILLSCLTCIIFQGHKLLGGMLQLRKLKRVTWTGQPSYENLKFPMWSIRDEHGTTLHCLDRCAFEDCLTCKQHMHTELERCTHASLLREKIPEALVSVVLDMLSPQVASIPTRSATDFSSRTIRVRPWRLLWLL